MYHCLYWFMNKCRNTCSNMLMYTNIYTESHRNTHNINFGGKTHPKHLITFSTIYCFKISSCSKFRHPKSQNLMCIFIVLLIFYIFQQ